MVIIILFSTQTTILTVPVCQYTSVLLENNVKGNKEKSKRKTEKH